MVAQSKKRSSGQTAPVASPDGNVFHRRLATLTYSQACQLIGPQGAELLRGASRRFEIESDRDVYLGGDL